MALIHCPECGHEISTAAVACPNCGRPIAGVPRVEKNVVVADVPRREDGFPKWAIIPLAVLGGFLMLVLFIMMSRSDDEANANLRVNVNTRPPSRDITRTNSLSDPTTTTTVPSTDGQTVTIPGSQTGITETAPAKSTVVIDAKVVARTGTPQPVKNEKFYLLDKDLEGILSEASLEPIEGNSLLTSFGLSVMFPDRYGDFQRDALRAIRDHIKYSGTTDGAGKAQLSGVEPNSYYLFGVTKAGRGFAVWSSPVSIVEGQNVLNLSPQRITEIEMSSGE